MAEFPIKEVMKQAVAKLNWAILHGLEDAESHVALMDWLSYLQARLASHKKEQIYADMPTVLQTTLRDVKRRSRLPQN